MTQRWADTLFQPTQWFPRVAVYDDLRGWDTELYLGPSEFYNNFGRFDVQIDVPAGWIVSGTGVLQNPQEVLTAQGPRAARPHVLGSDSVTTIVGADESRARARDARPGATGCAGTSSPTWSTTSPGRRRRTSCGARRARRSPARAVPIHMVYLPGHANLYANAGPIARHALEFYSKLWSPYPFPQFTLQDGPSAGMEYPMVINSNQGAADHETGHQWWPMMVSNNETWYGWMDEGFNQYMNILSDSSSQARGVTQGGGRGGRAGGAALFDGLGQSYGRTSGSEAEPPMMWTANYAGPRSTASRPTARRRSCSRCSAASSATARYSARTASGGGRGCSSIRRRGTTCSS